MGRHEDFPGFVKSAANILAPVHSPRPRRWSSANTSQSSRSPGQANTTSLNRRNAPRPSSARSSRSRRRWSGRVAVKSTMSSYARRDPVGQTCSHLSEGVLPSSSSKESSNTNSGHSSPFVRSSRPPALSGPPSIRSASCSRSTASCSSGVASAERSRDSQRGTSVTVVPNPPHLLRRIQTDRASLPRLSRSADRRVRHPVAPGLAGFIRTDTGRAVQIKAEVSRSSHALQRVHVLEHRHRAVFAAFIRLPQCGSRWSREQREVPPRDGPFCWVRKVSLDDRSGGREDLFCNFGDLRGPADVSSDRTRQLS